jgi:DNA-binding response OmpR family regulator
MQNFMPVAPPATPSLPERRETVLVLAGRRRERASLTRFAAAQGYLVLEASDVATARAQINHARPDLVLLHDDRNGLAALSALRAEPDAGAVAAIVLARRDDLPRLLRAFELGADDVLPRSVHRSELAARMRARLERRAIPREGLVRDPVTGALSPETLERAMGLEFERVRRTGRSASFAYLAFDELPSIEAAHGQRARDELLAQVVGLVEEDGRRVDVIGLSRNHLALLLPDTSSRGARTRLNRLVQKLHRRTFSVEGRALRMTPVVGYVSVDARLDVHEAQERAWVALMHSAAQLDLYPVEWRPAMSGDAEATGGSALRRALERHRTAMQVIGQQVACIGLPVLAYWVLDRAGFDVTGVVYLVIVAALALTAVAIWIEALAAFRPERPPVSPASPYPPASAIIAAYLPNEADTIVDTVRSFLRQDYPDLQVILAYNTPHDLPVEAELRDLATRDPRLVPIRVRDSVSKAQNVNAALAAVTGQFVGVFDADHHPAQGAFRRAWRWISHGADVVQGHCVVRDGDAGFLQRLVAVEFEAIYAVAHPGRARVQDFGIFGGSNGFWRTTLLRETRMRGFMLTEDIDSSMRVVAAGGRIISDPGLVSTELPPPDWRGLWNQRLRWAQGWSQVSLRHLITMLRSERLSRRQRFGLAYLLGWRELYPWISLQAFPILAYWFLRGAPPVDWFVPVFVLTTLFTTSAGVMQAWTAWRLARPHLRRRRRWFVAFGFASLLFYTEYKNVITRTAHLKEAMREQQWKVTPRPVVAARARGLPVGLAVERDAA